MPRAGGDTRPPLTSLRLAWSGIGQPGEDQAVAAYSDRRAQHGRPAGPWTLESIASRVAVCPATLARGFTPLLGRSPMACLTGWWRAG